MKYALSLLTNPIFWIFVGAGSSSLAAFFTLREQNVQIETVKNWTTGGNSVVYFQPHRSMNRLAFYIRHTGAFPTYDVTIRVHEVAGGRDGLVEELWHRLLGGPASENGTLRRGDGGHEEGDRRRRVLMLAILDKHG